MIRKDGRSAAELRPVSFTLDYTRWAEGSCLVRFGETVVLCNATLEEGVPSWQKEPSGWLTAEYAMLPRSTQRRTRREKRWPKGRTQEISRLIGRSLRQAVDLPLLGERTLIIDCDVLQADGGTRTAAITGGWVAVARALHPLIAADELPPSVLRHQIAAISVGIVDGEPRLDLPYVEDVAASVDFNVVMAVAGESADFVEVQGTAESEPFTPESLNVLLELAISGIWQLAQLQTAVLADTP